jgi:Tannase and feruloyl esterase
MNRQQLAVFFAVVLATITLVSIPSYAQRSCESLPGLKLPHATVTSAKSIAAGLFTPPPPPEGKSEAVDLPAFCRITGVIKPTYDSDVKFELWMPTKDWSGRFQQEGNGGYAGIIPYWSMIPALREGFATVSTDDGHIGGGYPTWAIGHPEKVIDFGYRAVHETAENSRRIIQTFYGHAPRKSYFVGCSDGGREALMEAQKFPADFDGILVGAPGNYWTHLFAAFAFNEKATLDDPASYIPESKLPTIQAGALAACDALDGVKDGIIDNPRDCHFDPANLECKGADSTSCLTAAQVEAAKKIYEGPKDPKTGEQIFPGVEPGDEAGHDGWNWITGSGPKMSKEYLYGASFFADMVYENLKWDFQNFDIDKDVKLADSKIGPILNSTNPDLRPFKSRGGKLIQYHGWADYAVPPQNSINYYESVVTAMAGLKSTAKFYRLFMVPGLEHCNGGPGPTTLLGICQLPASLDVDDRNAIQEDAGHDMILALERWVEHGIPPEQMIATKYVDNKPTKGVARTWLLCPYPEEAKWTGKGSYDSSASFVCQAPRKVTAKDGPVLTGSGIENMNKARRAEAFRFVAPTPP